MLHLNSKIKAEELEIKKLTTFDGGNGIMMAYRQSELHDLPPKLAEAVHEIETLRKKTARFVQVNSIPPGVSAGKHTDTLRCDYRLERWHFVISTNKEAWFEDSSGRFHMDQGCWYGPVAYWDTHDVGNDGNTERVHLVVDLETDGKPISDDDLRGLSQPIVGASGNLKPAGLTGSGK